MTNSSSTESPTIRPARPEDATALAPLSGQLGYPATAAETRSRLSVILDDPEQVVYVAELSGQIIGWIQAALYFTLESGAAVELRGLVVDERLRGTGVGRALLHQAERWALEHETPVVRLRCNVIRTGAHAFYQRLGYSLIKTQHAFRRQLE
jgi:GNAT superfamily N-acetyltransferase